MTRDFRAWILGFRRTAPMSIGGGSRGFTLIELMITVAVLAILLAIAFPNYQDYMRRAKRSAAKSALMDIAAKQQAYLIDRRQFAGGGTALGDLHYTVPPDVSADFAITVAANNAATPPTFTLTATPTSGLMQGDACGLSAATPLTLDQAGNKAPANCW